MKLIHIVGCKNDGKTTLIVELVKELKRRNLTVGTIKHSFHSCQIDRPDKDSFLHRQAGGDPSAIVAGENLAVYFSCKKDGLYQQLEPFFDKTDIIIVEGDKKGPGQKVEVWRKKIRPKPLFFERDDIKAVITDDPIDENLSVPVWPRKNMVKIADNICSLAGIKITT